MNKHIFSLMLKFIPAGILFLTIMQIGYIEDKKIRNIFLELLIYLPLFLPFVRFGFPVTILSIKNSNEQEKEFFKILNVQLILLIIILVPYFVINYEFYSFYIFVFLLSIINSILFNFGSLNLRQGHNIGFLYQNGLFNLLLFLYVLLVLYDSSLMNNHFFIILALLASLSILFYTTKGLQLRFKFKMLKFNLKSWFTDFSSAFYVPLIVFFTMKMLENPDAGVLLVLKVSALISGSIGSLIILQIKEMDALSLEEYKKAFFAMKIKLIPILVLLFFIFYIIIFFYDRTYINLLVMIFVSEIVIILLGQYNILLNYSKMYLSSALAIVFTAFLIGIVFLIIKFINVNLSSMESVLFYSSSIIFYHLFSRFLFVNRKGLN